jgi:hypothetical protein
MGRGVRSPESYLQLFRDLSANSWMQTPAAYEIVDGLHQYARAWRGSKARSYRTR